VLNEIEDFELLLSLGLSGEEIYELSFSGNERQFIYYLGVCDNASDYLDKSSKKDVKEHE
tara:strand:- start:1931 stop:2110 length:180 start_codon:yes stop_codon:yes gene_type:complete